MLSGDMFIPFQVGIQVSSRIQEEESQCWWSLGLGVGLDFTLTCLAHGSTPSLEVSNPTELFTECSWWQRTQNGALATTSSAGKFLHFRNIFLRETKTGRGRERGRRRWNEQRREEKQKLDVGPCSINLCSSVLLQSSDVASLH